MKKPATRIKELRLELRFWQMQCRTEARWLRQSRAKVKQIAAQMRKIQKEK